MEAKVLSFGEQLQVSQFKARFHVDTIDIVKSPTTGKLFFTAGEVRGAVAENYKEAPVFSFVTVPDKAESFWLLHKKGSSNTVDTL